MVWLFRFVMLRWNSMGVVFTCRTKTALMKLQIESKSNGICGRFISNIRISGVPGTSRSRGTWLLNESKKYSHVSANIPQNRMRSLQELSAGLNQLAVLIDHEVVRKRGDEVLVGQTNLVAALLWYTWSKSTKSLGSGFCVRDSLKELTSY